MLEVCRYFKLMTKINHCTSKKKKKFPEPGFKRLLRELSLALVKDCKVTCIVRAAGPNDLVHLVINLFSRNKYSRFCRCWSSLIIVLAQGGLLFRGCLAVCSVISGCCNGLRVYYWLPEGGGQAGCRKSLRGRLAMCNGISGCFNQRVETYS